MLARNVTWRPSPALSGVPAATGPTYRPANPFVPADTYAMNRESGDHTRSFGSKNGGVGMSIRPVATSFSSFDAGSTTRSSRPSRSKAIQRPSGEKCGRSSRNGLEVSAVSRPVAKSYTKR